jgi:hypothetical protein
MIKWAYKEHKRCTHDDLYGAGHPPDSIVAGSLAASLFVHSCLSIFDKNNFAYPAPLRSEAMPWD